MVHRAVLGFSCLALLGCVSSPATGERGRVELAFCDPVPGLSDELCHGSSALAAGSSALWFVDALTDESVDTARSEDPSVLEVRRTTGSAPLDVFQPTAYRSGVARVAVLDADGAVVDRFELTVRDIASIRVLDPPDPVEASIAVPAAGRVLTLDCRARDGQPLVGVGALELTVEGALGVPMSIGDYLADTLAGRAAAVRERIALFGPLEGGEGRVRALAPTGASLEVPLVFERAALRDLSLRVLDTSGDEALVEAEIALDVNRAGCCAWSVSPAGGPVTIRSEECAQLRVRSGGVSSRADVHCSVLGQTASIEVVFP